MRRSRCLSVQRLDIEDVIDRVNITEQANAFVCSIRSDDASGPNEGAVHF